MLLVKIAITYVLVGFVVSAGMKILSDSDIKYMSDETKEMLEKWATYGVISVSVVSGGFLILVLLIIIWSI